MIITKIIGGLGNQMFQYAMGLSLAENNQTPLKLDLSQFTGYKLHNGFELSKVFNCSAEIASVTQIETLLGICKYSFIRRILKKTYLKNLRPAQYVVEPFFGYWDGVSFLGDNVYLDGYWQSQKYFIDHESTIRTHFTFKNILSDENLKLSDRIKVTNSVSLHIRRGDYVTNKNNAFIGTCSLIYYQNAIEYFSQKIADPIFFIFSDDITWAKSNLRLANEHYFVGHNQGEDSHFDMQLMSLCKHHIIANSSFSWWAAWLNPSKNKIVAAPKKWFANGLNDQDLVPNSWVRI